MIRSQFCEECGVAGEWGRFRQREAQEQGLRLDPAWQVQKRKKASVAGVIEDQERGNPDHGEEFGFILHAATRVFMFEKTTQVAVRRYISGSQESAIPG